MNRNVIHKVQTMTLRQLMKNLENDQWEDADTDFSWDMTIEEYIKNLFDL